MVQNSPEQQPNATTEPITTPKKSSLKTLMLFEVGLIEIVFVAAMLCLIFFTLNFFHIVALEKIYPPFSSLPRFTRATPTPTPTPYVYDVQKAHALLSSFQLGTLKTPYLSETTDNPQMLIGSNNIFTRDWENPREGTRVHTQLTLQPKTNIESIYWITVQMTLSASESATISSTSASKLLSKYFILPQLTTPMICTRNTCEQFDTLHIGKEGVGIIYGPQTTLFFCYLPNYTDFQTPIFSCPQKTLK